MQRNPILLMSELVVHPWGLRRLYKEEKTLPAWYVLTVPYRSARLSLPPQLLYSIFFFLS